MIGREGLKGWEPKGRHFNGVDGETIASTPEARAKTDPPQSGHSDLVISRLPGFSLPPPPPARCLRGPLPCRPASTGSPASLVRTAFYHILGHPGFYLLWSARPQVLRYGTRRTRGCLLRGHPGELPLFCQQRRAGQWGTATAHEAGHPPSKDSAGLGGSCTCPEVPGAGSVALGRVAPPVVKEPSKTGNVSGGVAETTKDFLSKLEPRGGGEVVKGKIITTRIIIIKSCWMNCFLLTQPMQIPNSTTTDTRMTYRRKWLCWY